MLLALVCDGVLHSGRYRCKAIIVTTLRVRMPLRRAVTPSRLCHSEQRQERRCPVIRWTRSNGGPSQYSTTRSFNAGRRFRLGRTDSVPYMFAKTRTLGTPVIVHNATLACPLLQSSVVLFHRAP